MKPYLNYAAIALAALLVLLGVYGVAIEPRLILDERHYQASLPGVATQWEGAEVAVFSDLQVGMWWANIAMVERVVDRVVEADPDAALIGGDFVYSTSPRSEVQVDTVLRLLDPLIEAGIPTFAVLGNHEYNVGVADKLTAAMRDAGITVLRNEAASIPAKDGGESGPPLYVVGLGPPSPGQFDVEKAFDDVPDGAPRVVLLHNPTAFPAIPAGSAPLAVAGDTHCGQIALPGTADWSYLGLTEEETVVADGFTPKDYGAQGNKMFVTCGIGFSAVPVRINAPPQVVFFELTAAK